MTATKKTKERLRGKKTLKVGNFLNEFEKDDVKAKVDIVSLFDHFGVELKKKGKSFSGHCPWHEDKTPSLSVDKEKGLYNCFGCGEAGDVFTLTEKIQNIEFREALLYLKDFIHTHPVSLEIPNPPTTVSRPQGESTINVAAPVEKNAQTESSGRDAELKAEAISLTTAADYYHKRLLENKEALGYLHSRGFNGFELIKRFKLGFADGTVTEKLSEAQKMSLTETGILSEKGYEHFKNCIIFPVYDSEVETIVVGMYGRSIKENSSVPHLYLKGEHEGIFNRKASKVYDEIILTECILDALSLIQLGIENSQSLYGTNGLTEEHLQILKDDRVKTVILALDNDQAGETAAAKLKGKLLAEGFVVKIISPPEVKDWNEYLVNSGTAEKVKELIATAEIYQLEEGNVHQLSVTKDTLGHVFTLGVISYRVTGAKEVFVSNLRVNMKATCSDTDIKYYDNLDLYSARSRSSYSSNLSREFDIEQKRIERDLITILEYFEKERDRHLCSSTQQEEVAVLTSAERDLGLSFLKSPDLFGQIVEDMDVLGYVGEDLNKQLLYIAATSRKLEDPISVLLVSESSSGKSMLVEKLSLLIPPEEVLAVTSLSDQALNYAEDLMHKFLDMSEAVHNEGIDHQIREMLSGKRLSRFVTVKDTQSGKMVSKIQHTPAVVSLVMSGTNYNLNPENSSRCFVVNVDESREQTKRIHKRQQKKHSLSRHYEKSSAIPEIIKKHHAAQKLLEKITVINPLAEHIKFPVTVMRTRRDHDRFLDLIACVCFLRQYQKERTYEDNVEYIECDLEDYEIASEIMIKGILTSTLLDIPNGTMSLYEEIRDMARKQAKERGIETTQLSFIQRDIREYTGLGSEFIKKHLRTLVEYEYIQLTSGRARGTRRSYRLRADEPLERVDFSMIPGVEDMTKRLNDVGRADLI